MSRVYIAGPFTDPRPEVIAWHVARACLLGRLASAVGLVPVVVHEDIAAGVYGDDADPVQRASGRARTMEVVWSCAGVWALRRDDGTMSEGTDAEYRGTDGRRLAGTWAEWRGLVERAAPDLLGAWDALAVTP